MKNICSFQFYARLFFAITISLSLSDWCHAQRIRFGLEMGASKIAAEFDAYHNLKQVGWHEPQSRPAFNGMILLDIPLQKRLSLQPGLRFRRFGTSVDYDFLIVGGDAVDNAPGMFKLTHAFLSVPLRLKYNFDALYVLAGPELAYLLSARVFDRQQYAIIGTLEHEANLIKVFNRLNLALHAGLGYEIKLFGSIVYLQALYAYGITDMSKAFIVSTFAPWTWRSHELNLSLGYLF